jgi:hypothetical protein
MELRLFVFLSRSGRYVAAEWDDTLYNETQPFELPCMRRQQEKVEEGE